MMPDADAPRRCRSWRPPACALRNLPLFRSNQIACQSQRIVETRRRADASITPLRDKARRLDTRR